MHKSTDTHLVLDLARLRESAPPATSHVWWAHTQGDYLSAVFLAPASVNKWVVFRPDDPRSLEMLRGSSHHESARLLPASGYIVLCGASEPAATIGLLASLCLRTAACSDEAFASRTIAVMHTDDEARLADTLYSEAGITEFVATITTGDPYVQRLLALTSAPADYEGRWWPLHLDDSEPPFHDQHRRLPLAAELYDPTLGDHGGTRTVAFSPVIRALHAATSTIDPDLFAHLVHLEPNTPRSHWRPRATAVAGWMLLTMLDECGLGMGAPAKAALAAVRNEATTRTAVDSGAVLRLIDRVALHDLLGAPRPAADHLDTLRRAWARRNKIRERLANDPLHLQQATRSCRNIVDEVALRALATAGDERSFRDLAVATARIAVRDLLHDREPNQPTQA